MSIVKCLPQHSIHEILSAGSRKEELFKIPSYTLASFNAFALEIIVPLKSVPMEKPEMPFFIIVTCYL